MFLCVNMFILSILETLTLQDSLIEEIGLKKISDPQHEIIND